MLEKVSVAREAIVGARFVCTTPVASALNSGAVCFCCAWSGTFFARQHVISIEALRCPSGAGEGSDMAICSQWLAGGSAAACDVAGPPQPPGNCIHTAQADMGAGPSSIRLTTNAEMERRLVTTHLL